MTDAPRRIRRSRAKGWRMPENTACVDRSTRWGNPFIVGKHGTQAECVRQYEYMLSGYINLCKGNVDQIMAARRFVGENWKVLRGKNLACWCQEGTPCHADVLLKLVNS